MRLPRSGVALSRREMALQVIARGAITYGQIAQRIDRHVSSDLSDLRADGLIELRDGEYTITDAGRVALRTK